MATGIQAHSLSTAAPQASAPGPFALAPAPLLALTHDERFLALLRRCSDPRPLRALGSEIDLSAALLEAHAGVAVLDCAAVATPVEALTARLAAQFPELVLVVAGNGAEQGTLSAQIAAGGVHRFLHKPLSEQRVRLFLESAWRRHAEAPLSRPRAAAPRRPRVRAPLIALLLGFAALGAYLFWPAPPLAERPAPRVAPAPAARDAGLEALLTRADQALAAGTLSGAPESAAALYQEALRSHPREPRALAGIAQVAERLLAQAEAQLQDKHLDAAQQLIDAARGLQADQPRVAFLAAQLDAQRERLVLGKAQRAAAAGDLAGALALLDEAGRGGQNSTLLSEARAQLAQKQLAARIADFLLQARSAAEHGALLAPVEQNARFYLESALALAPTDPAALAARAELAARLQSQARQSLAAGNPEDADTYAAGAADLGAAADAVAALHAAAGKLRETTRLAAERKRTEGLFQERLREGRLLEPAGDSARDYLQQIAQSDTPADAQAARSAFAARLVDAARGALEAHDTGSARRWASEARSAGASPTELATVEALVQSAAAAEDVPAYVNASTLQRTRYLAPVYPSAAEARGLEGWVDVQFLVQPDGSVADATVVGAEPAGVFETAALDAVRHWRYQPVRHDGQTIAQPARLRVRFTEHR
ncbi:MAG: TonB family protein [Gammaproteobacteria bacterium]|nr:TonB family protein [Gammaproteobacteria bacterium]